METRARYILIGSFALAVLLAGFGFVYWIKTLGGFGQRAVYDVRFEQPVSGLTAGAGVLFNGIRAGTVTRIDLNPNNPKQVNAAVSVDPQTPIRADTQVDITYLGFTGADAVEQDARAWRQPGHRLLEADIVDRPLSETAEGLDPVDKAEAGQENGQREGADQDVAGAGLHDAVPVKALKPLRAARGPISSG